MMDSPDNKNGRRFDNKSLEGDADGVGVTQMVLSENYDENELIKDSKLQSKQQVSNKEHAGSELTERQVLKNIVLVSISLFLLFTAYLGLANIQSSLHIAEGMGVINQSIVYGFMSVGCLVLPKPAIHLLGHKWCMVLSMIGYILWMAANGYAVWGTMVTASIIVGLCASTLWTAQRAYITIVARKYAEMRSESFNAVNARFFGIYFAIFELNSVPSAIIQPTVLQQGIPENFTGPTEEEIILCGLNDCPWNNLTNVNFYKASSTVLWTLVSTYIGLAVVAFTMAAILIDKIPLSWIPDENKSGSTREKVIKSVGATLMHLRHINQLHLIPLTVYLGLIKMFFISEFNRSYVTCNLGLWMITLVTLPRAFVSAITCFGAGRMVKYTGMLPIFIGASGYPINVQWGVLPFSLIFAAMFIDVGCYLTLLLWTPHPDHVFMFFLIPALQGISVGINQALLSAFYGVLFPNETEAAFSNFNMWESFGCIIGFAWSSHLCTSVKLYISMTFFFIGYLFLYVLKYRMKKQERKWTLNNANVVKKESYVEDETANNQLMQDETYRPQ